MSDELREKPNGKFCYYKEANESHKEVLAEYSEPVNESLLEALQGYMSAVKDMSEAMKDGYNVQGAISALVGWEDMARAAIAKAIGEEE
ncbi:hypothetical protein [Cronobacter sakazakii]|nr:hypothetical protein [Cronobacter sakazakii]